MTGPIDLPPAARSAAALRLTVEAVLGRFALQRCSECQALSYPPADICHSCLSSALAWQEVKALGTVVAATAVHRSLEPYFAGRPWPVGLIRHDEGAALIAHLGPGCVVGDPVELALCLDAAGRGVLLARRCGGAFPAGFSERVEGICHLVTPDPIAAGANIGAALPMDDGSATMNMIENRMTIAGKVAGEPVRIVIATQAGSGGGREN